MTLPDWSIPAALGAGAAVLIGWNLSLGVRLSTLPGTGRTLRTLSGLAGFLFVPALVIGALAPSAPGARVLGPLAWLWPLVTIVFVVQALLAASHGRASALIAAPLVLYDLVAAWVAGAQWVESVGGTLPEWALVPGMAVSTFAASAVGAAAFPWGAAALMPALVPAAPARRRSTRVGRVLVAAGAAAAFAVIVLAMPRAHDTLRSTQTLDAGPPEANARGDLAIGIALFGVLSGSPSATSARHDVSLADSLGVTAVHVTLTPAGTTAAVLDSLARSIELRRDSLVLVVTLRIAPNLASAPGATARMAMIERVVRRLRPEVLLPAEGVATGAGAPTVEAWKAYYETAAATAQRVNRRVVLGLATDASTPVDSALVDWVMQGGSRVGAVALTVRDRGAEPERFTNALHSMARWTSMARALPEVWIVGVPSAPTITGEVVQQRLVRHALLWAAARPWVRGVIAGDASDITTPVGLRTASGRARRAVAEVGAALRAQRDALTAPPAPDPIAAADSTAAAARVPAPDTLIPPPR